MKVPTENQPVLPRVSMRWYFGVVAVFSGLIAWVLSSSHQQTLLAIILVLSLATISFLSLSAILFAVAYLVGSVEKIFFRPEEQIESPFAHEAMPPQIIPPLSDK